MHLTAKRPWYALLCDEDSDQSKGLITFQNTKKISFIKTWIFTSSHILDVYHLIQSSGGNASDGLETSI